MHTLGDEISPKPLQINEIDAINLTDTSGANRSARDRLDLALEGARLHVPFLHFN